MKNSLIISMILSWFCSYSQSSDQSLLNLPSDSKNFSVANSLIITEIFADPAPRIELPETEFIELFNPGAETIYLRNWLYSDATTTFKFSADSLKAGEYLILCPRADVSFFTGYGRVLGLSPWPSLNNAGDLLTLKNESGLIINQVSYADTWYKDASKRSGGYSLEIIDPASTCSGIQNWKASLDISGGTPGKQNSVYKKSSQTDGLKLLTASLSDSASIVLTFNNSLDSVSSGNINNYMLNNGIGQPLSATLLSPDLTQVKLTFRQIIPRGNNYRITVNTVFDCAGTVISLGFNSAEFFIPKQIFKKDILINEILFNPRPNGSDFVEIYNHSNSVLDLRELFVATLKNDTLSNKSSISSDQFFIKPAEYFVLSTDPENIKKEYFQDNKYSFIKMKQMPGFSNDKGIVILLSNNLIIDQFNYSEEMHFPLIRNAEGISLERTMFNRPTNDAGNFRSAAASTGFATPGYKNSQFTDELNSDEEFTLSSKTFSPDNDGFEDELQINYHFVNPGLVANISVYNDKGILIKKLAENLTLSSAGIINWNGFDEFSRLLPVGIYLVYAELFDLEGKLKKYRRTIVLAQKFN